MESPPQGQMCRSAWAAMTTPPIVAPTTESTSRGPGGWLLVRALCRLADSTVSLSSQGAERELSGVFSYEDTNSIRFVQIFGPK